MCHVGQKLIQTRDAIGAQKAVVVSATGFTWEAKEVAQANGVALWVMGSERALDEDGIVGAMYGSSRGLETIIQDLQLELEFVLSPYFVPWPALRRTLVGNMPRPPRLVPWKGSYKRIGNYFVWNEWTGLSARPALSDLFPAFARTAANDKGPAGLAFQRWRLSAIARMTTIGLSRETAKLIVEEPLLDGESQNWPKIQATCSELFRAPEAGERLYRAFQLASSVKGERDSGLKRNIDPL